VPKKVQLAVGLDVGSTQTRVVVCTLENENIIYRAHASAPSRGWQRGQIADQGAVASSVQTAIREAERLAGEPIGSAVVGVGGPPVRALQGRGIYEFGHRRPITRDDLRWALHLAARPMDDDERIILHVLPQDFTVDGRPPVPHPLNLECLRLEAHALLITAATQDHQALISSIHQASIKVEETVFEALAAAYASILPEERASGVALIDIGCQSTNAVYYDGDAMLYAAGLPISGDHFTRDLGELKGLSYDESERLKMAHGCALLGLSADNIIIELPAEGGRPVREVYRRELIEILEARAVQLFQIIENRRVRFSRDLTLREGVVLTGGGSLLEGMVEVAEKVLSCPARLGFPRGIDGWPEDLLTPLWTVAAGLSMYSARLQLRKDKGSTSPTFWSLFTSKS
jgi:cell division protein FtsA